MRRPTRGIALIGLAILALVLLLRGRARAPLANDRLPRHDTLRVLTAAERAKVQGHAHLTLRGDFDASLYNGSDCLLTRVWYRLIPRNAPVTTTPVRSMSITVAPKYSERVTLAMDSTLRANGLPRWFVDSLEGRCPAG